MTNLERLEIFNMPTIAVYSESAFSGFAVNGSSPASSTLPPASGMPVTR